MLPIIIIIIIAGNSTHTYHVSDLWDHFCTIVFLTLQYPVSTAAAVILEDTYIYLPTHATHPTSQPALSMIWLREAVI